jgi:hypothetical protein
MKALAAQGLTLAEIGQREGVTRECVRLIVSDQPKPQRMAQRRQEAFARLDALGDDAVHLPKGRLAALGDTTPQTIRQWKRNKLFGGGKGSAPKYEIVPLGAAAKRRAAERAAASHHPR